MFWNELPALQEFSGPRQRGVFIRSIGSAALFSVVGSEAQNLECPCGELLIEHYEPHLFLDVGLLCHSCRRVTETASLPNGEVLPANVVNVGSGVVHLGSPVTVRHNVAVASDREVQRVARWTEPASDRPLQIGLTQEKLEAVGAVYDDVIRGRYKKQLSRLGRYQNLSNREPADKFPIPWAIEYIRRSLNETRLDFYDLPTRLAMTRLLMFSDVYNKWRLHPHFFEAARSFENSFPHTASAMLMAANLTEAGNPTALALETTVGDGNPDLYFRPNAVDKFYLEVKAPRELQWMPKVLCEYDVDNAVLKSLKNTRGQLSRSRGRPGALVISSAIAEDGFGDFIQKRAWIVLGMHGAKFRSVSDILIISPARLQANRETETSLFVRSAFHIARAANPHWQGQKVFRGEGLAEPKKYRKPLFERSS